MEVREYLSNDGRCPFTEWMLALRDIDARARILVRLNRVRLGNPGDCKAVGEGVWELRIPRGAGYRVYFARPTRACILLLCGGDKGSQRRDINKAKRYWKDYQEQGDAQKPNLR